MWNCSQSRGIPVCRTFTTLGKLFLKSIPPRPPPLDCLELIQFTCCCFFSSSSKKLCRYNVTALQRFSFLRSFFFFWEGGLRGAAVGNEFLCLCSSLFQQRPTHFLLTARSLKKKPLQLVRARVVVVSCVQGSRSKRDKDRVKEKRDIEVGECDMSSLHRRLLQLVHEWILVSSSLICLCVWGAVRARVRAGLRKCCQAAFVSVLMFHVLNTSFLLSGAALLLQS